MRAILAFLWSLLPIIVFIGLFSFFDINEINFKTWVHAGLFFGAIAFVSTFLAILLYALTSPPPTRWGQFWNIPLIKQEKITNKLESLCERLLDRMEKPEQKEKKKQKEPEKTEPKDTLKPA